MGFDDLVPEHIRALRDYVPGKPVSQAKRESGVQCIKLASNENPFGPSPRALEAMARVAAGSNFYPDNFNFDLRTRLAELHGLQLEQLLITHGSTSFLDIIARTLLHPGLNAVTSERSFIVYGTAVRAAGGKLIEAPMRADTFDLDALLAAMNPNTRIALIANPNNPTGTMLDVAALDAFMARVPEHVLVVLDEAYCDFAEYHAARRGVSYSRSLDYVRQGRQVIVLRTFSKAHGLAGLRVGYGFAPPAILQHFARVRTAFSVSSMGEAAALAALDDTEHIRRSVESIVHGAEFLSERLRELGLRVVPTCASFVYFETSPETSPETQEPADVLARRIQERGIIVRPLTAWGVPNGIRVSVGTPEQNEQFIATLKKCLQRVPAR